MRVIRSVALFGFVCASVVLAQAPPGPIPQTAPAAPKQKSAPAQTPPATSQAIKTQTRLISVDVVVTDSHGAPVRGLKKEDFQIFEERNHEQQIAQFQFVDRAPNASRATAAAAPSTTLFSNELAGDRAVAPTVLLMDALNTDITNQAQVRQHMVTLLNTLPASTPVAVFSLGHTLRVIQGFSTDPRVLPAAIAKAMRSVPIEQNPQDDANSLSNRVLAMNDDQETQETKALEDFEALEYQGEMAIRVDETTDAMIQIAKYLGGYPGRKNLVWFSEAFPIWIEPSTDFGTNAFLGSATYGDKVQAAAQALTDAQVAVYPVDATGLAADQLYSAAQNPPIHSRRPGGGLGDQLNRDNTQHLNAQDTMENIAQTTGGRACKNTNDLSGCVQSALNDGATYYELSYYPQGIAWDGRFHKITVKTVPHGLKLAYRRGYFATDLKNAAGRQKPEELLKHECQDSLPSSAITLTVEPVAPQPAAAGAAEAGQTKYLVTVSPKTLSFEPAGGVRHVNLQMAICEFDPKDHTFQFFEHDLSRPVPENLYKSWQERGFRNVFDYESKPEDQRVRFAVLDVPSGELGSVDVPAHPREFASMPAGVTPVGAAAPPANPAPPKPVQVMTNVKFKGSSGQTSELDWSGDKLLYHGDLGIDLGAPALFKSLYGEKFHCDGGKLVPSDPGSSARPSFLFTFHNPNGTGALVELGGDAPAYSGNLPIDASARAFFDYLWKLCHCQQP